MTITIKHFNSWKKYKHEEENPGKNVLKEPVIKYSKQAETEMTFSPPLTEEELKNAITGEELIKSTCKFIDELFDRDENSIHWHNPGIP